MPDKSKIKLALSGEVNPEPSAPTLRDLENFLAVAMPNGMLDPHHYNGGHRFEQGVRDAGMFERLQDLEWTCLSARMDDNGSHVVMSLEMRAYDSYGCYNATIHLDGYDDRWQMLKDAYRVKLTPDLFRHAELSYEETQYHRKSYMRGGRY